MSQLLSLPSELLVAVLRWLPYRDILQFGISSKPCNTLSNDAGLWRGLCYTGFPFVQSKVTDTTLPKKSWKEYFISLSIQQWEDRFPGGTLIPYYAQWFVFDESKCQITNTYPHRTNFNCTRGQNGWTSGIHFWEITVNTYSGHGAYVSLGVCSTQFDFAYWIGSPSNGGCLTSVGTLVFQGDVYEWHSDEDTLFGQGDTIGVALNLDSRNGSVVFWLNGKCLGEAYHNLKAIAQPDGKFYPAISVPGACTVIKANFQGPFRSQPFKHGLVTQEEWDKIEIVNNRSLDCAKPREDTAASSTRGKKKAKRGKQRRK